MKKLFLALAFVLAMAAQSQAATISAVLTWSDNSTNEDGFNVERSNDPAGPFSRFGGTLANVATFTDSPLALSTQYCYRVNAFNTAGVSGYSNVACVTTPGLPVDPNGLVIQLQVKP